MVMAFFFSGRSSVTIAIPSSIQPSLTRSILRCLWLAFRKPVKGTKDQAS